MEQSEFIIDSQKITAQIKCSLFGSKEYVYYILNYTSKANWYVSVDPMQYDENCKCYKQDPYKLISKEIEQAKAVILERIKNQAAIERIKQKEIEKKTTAARIVKQPVPDLMKHKNIKIKEIDWRD